MSPTAISWTDETWNPTVGCTRVSPGCLGCYAIGVAHRALQPAHVGLTIRRPGERTDWTGEVRLLPDRLDTPLRWRKPRRVFVDSMSDLFHADVPDAFVAKVYAAMVAASDMHTFQVLTKRPQRMARLLSSPEFQQLVQEEVWALHTHMFAGFVRPNIWWGTSIESDAYAWRADHVRATPAAVRFLSLEPLLGPLPSLDLTGIDWVIVGGESGPGARPMHPQWVRDIRDRCGELGIPFFFKQWGAFGPAGAWSGPDHHVTIDGHLFLPGERLGMNHMAQPAAIHRWGARAAGCVLDGREWHEFPT